MELCRPESPVALCEVIRILADKDAGFGGDLIIRREVVDEVLPGY
jgi:hypothetical protein